MAKVSEGFVHQVILDEAFPERGDRFALCGLIVETISVYYWCEAFTLRGKLPKKFCVLGQRGLAEYAAKRATDILRLIELAAATRDETIGWQYGAVMSLRDTIHKRRDAEQESSIYQEQMTLSVYRARKVLKQQFRIGNSDARATFDIAGFNRGKSFPWDLSTLRAPLAVLDTYISKHGAQHAKQP